MRRREPFCFVAFDLLAVNGRDMHKLSLIDWKQILREIVPEESRSILFAKHVPQHGRDLFAAVCERDLEGVMRNGRQGGMPIFGSRSGGGVS
jgi:ATP-dependent DNA ligase